MAITMINWKHDETCPLTPSLNKKDQRKHISHAGPRLALQQEQLDLRDSGMLIPSDWRRFIQNDKVQKIMMNHLVLGVPCSQSHFAGLKTLSSQRDWWYSIMMGQVPNLSLWMRKNLVLWPRVEQRKWILAKNKNKNKNIITKKTNRQEESPEETKKTRKKQEQQQTKKQNLHFPQFFFLFFPWFWFSSLFFLFALFFFAFLFFCQTYILCVVGLINLVSTCASEDTRLRNQ